MSVRVFGGEVAQLRVWEDLRNGGVLLCSEREYQRALTSGEAPLYVGFPAVDIVTPARAANAAIAAVRKAAGWA